MKHTRSEELRNLLKLLESRPELNNPRFVVRECLEKELESAEGLEEIERKLEGIDPNKDILRVFSNDQEPLSELQKSDTEILDTYNKYQEFLKNQNNELRRTI